MAAILSRPHCVFVFVFDELYLYLYLYLIRFLPVYLYLYLYLKLRKKMYLYLYLYLVKRIWPQPAHLKWILTYPCARQNKECPEHNVTKDRTCDIVISCL